MISAKDKALDLYFKYEKEIRIYRQNGFEYDGRKAKNCALIAVDEIRDNLPLISEIQQYWINVKQEIQKL